MATKKPSQQQLQTLIHRATQAITEQEAKIKQQAERIQQQRNNLTQLKQQARGDTGYRAMQLLEQSITAQVNLMQATQQRRTKLKTKVQQLTAQLEKSANADPPPESPPTYVAKRGDGFSLQSIGTAVANFFKPLRSTGGLFGRLRQLATQVLGWVAQKLFKNTPQTADLRTSLDPEVTTTSNTPSDDVANLGDMLQQLNTAYIGMDATEDEEIKAELEQLQAAPAALTLGELYAARAKDAYNAASEQPSRLEQLKTQILSENTDPTQRQELISQLQDAIIDDSSLEAKDIAGLLDWSSRLEDTPSATDPTRPKI